MCQVRGLAAGPARPVELSVVVENDVRPWRYPPRQEFMDGEWLRDTYEPGGAPQPEPAPDLSVLITMVLQGALRWWDLRPRSCWTRCQTTTSSAVR
jgi:streptomycin 3"-adenylyltransferase